jgi:hypothetical protein
MKGHVEITDDKKSPTTISLNADNATITAGGNGVHGIVSLNDETTPVSRILLNASFGSVIVRRALNSGESGSYIVIGMHGSTGDVSVGGNGQDGDLVLFRAGITESDPASDKSKATIHLRASDGTVRTGGSGVDGRMLVLGKDDSARITLQGSSGDILLANADCAEEFDVAEDASPGTVMSLDDDGRLCASTRSYDRRVAGVVSGAGGYRPALVLDAQGAEGRLPIALVGKVCCNVDATRDPIAPGDLLTTSPTPGHAMKASDPRRFAGAVLGKALRPLDSGRALVPILVTLQ